MVGREGTPVSRLDGRWRTENADEDGMLTWLEGGSAEDGAPIFRTFVRRRFTGLEAELELRDI